MQVYLASSHLLMRHPQGEQPGDSHPLSHCSVSFFARHSDSCRYPLQFDLIKPSSVQDRQPLCRRFTRGCLSGRNYGKNARERQEQKVKRDRRRVKNQSPRNGTPSGAPWGKRSGSGNEPWLRSALAVIRGGQGDFPCWHAIGPKRKTPGVRGQRPRKCKNKQATGRLVIFRASCRPALAPRCLRTGSPLRRPGGSARQSAIPRPSPPRNDAAC
jgi:hypothetical protein